jgi:hypothetical protein
MASPITHTPAEYAGNIVERPDGFYWIDPDSSLEFGPFATAALAIADMEPSPESNYEPGETLKEAEAELDIADWIDPETGLPAEDSVHRLED